MKRTLAIMSIPLSQGLFALVDGKNYERLSKFKWHADKNRTGFYARRSCRRNGKQTSVRMHAEIFGEVPAGKVLDHINRNGLDNREQNIRACTNHENLCNMSKSRKNTSGYRGVCRVKRLGKWLASISHNGRSVNLGVHDKIVDAARAYDKAAVRFRGQFACLNFPDEHKAVEKPVEKAHVHGGCYKNQYLLWG